MVQISAAIQSIGSGTIYSGRRTAKVTDTVLVSGSIVFVTLTKDPSQAAGAGPVKAIVYTTGSPAAGNYAFTVTVQGVVDKDIPFTYAIISGTDINP